MRKVELKARLREELGTRAAKRLRRQGLIPGVIYGRGIEPVHIALKERELEPLLEGGVRFVSVSVGDTTYDAVVQDVHYDYLNERLLHIDLHRVLMTERIRIAVPLVFKGEPKCGPGGGTVEKHLEELEVECVASEAPESIEVDLSVLDVGKSLHVGDLSLPEGVEALMAADVAVVSVVASRVEEESEVAEEEEEREPEVVKRPKKEEEEE
ncbi:MAG: 50S ribosomal protein L25 [Planctomycetota bacterium]|nr:MAG: 50S ribosomal protein L25 [Planctomycetota bacterium]